MTLLGVALLILILSIVLGIRSCGKNDSVDYIFQPVSKGEVVRTVFVTGKVLYLSVYIVKSEVPGGYVSAVNAGINSNVKKNDILATIAADDTLFNSKQTRENLYQANLGVDATKDLYEQKQKLFNGNFISAKELEDSKRNYDRALSNQRYWQNAMDKLNVDLAACTVRSPVNGLVTQAWAFPQMNIGKGTDLFEIVDNMKKMNLELNIDETDIGMVRQGSIVDFSVSAFPDKKFKGKITLLTNTPVTQNNIVTYKAYAECDNPEQLLKSGMSATASIFVEKVDNVLRVPNEALTASPVFLNVEPGKRFVWKKSPPNDHGGMRKTQVAVGLAGNNFSQIIGGNLKDTDQVLVQVRKKTKGQSIPGL